MNSRFVSLCWFLAMVLIPLVPRAMAPTAAASPQLTSLDDYISELGRCLDVLAKSRNDPTELRNLRLSLPRQWEIRASDQTYVVDADWLASDLARAETALKNDRSVLQQAQQDVAAHRKAAEALAQSLSGRNLNDSRARLNRILAAEEFQASHGPTWLESLRARLYDWIARQLQKLYAKFPRGRTMGNAIAWTVIALTTLLLLLWLIRAVSPNGAGAEMDLRG